MDHQKRKRDGGHAGIALFVALLACLLIAGTMYFHLSETRQVLNAGNPETLLGQLDADSKWVADMAAEQFVWLDGVAARMAAQPDEEAMWALLPEVKRERDGLLRLCLLDADGTGVSENGESVTGIADEGILRNALNSPWQRAMEYIDSDGEPTVQTAVAFLDAATGTRVLLAIRPAEDFAAPEAVGQDLLVVTQRGIVVAASGARVIPPAYNLLDTLAAPEVGGTPSSAMYQAFLDFDRGVSWHLFESGWICLLYTPIEGTSWMAALALRGNMIHMDAGAVERLPALLMMAAGACAVLCALLLCMVLIRRASKRKRMHEQRELLLHLQEDSEHTPPPSTPAESQADNTM